MTDRPTIAILYGLGEGALLSRQLCAALRQSGFQPTDNILEADILLAHSGGALSIPQDAKAKTVLIVGPVTGYKGHVLTTQFRKLILDCKGMTDQGKILRWLGKSFINGWYLLTQPHKVIGMWRAAHSHRNILPILKGKRVGVLTFRDDPWSGFLGEGQLHHTQPYMYLNFSQLHDDIWINPKRYVSVIQYLYES